MSKSLFRQEAIDAQREKLLGEASIAGPVPLWVLSLLALAIAMLVVSIGLWGEYTRRERAEGFLASNVGAARIMISDAGVITELMVEEGSQVETDAPLARVAVDRAARNGRSSGARVLEELTSRRAHLDNESAQVADLGRHQVRQIRKRSEDLNNEIQQLDGEIRLQEQRLASSVEAAARYQNLARDRFVSELALRQKQDEVTDQKIRVQALRRQRAGLEKELSSARLDIPTTEMRTRTQVEQIKRQASELRQMEAAEEIKRETMIRAPVAGTITNITISRGQTVAPDTPMATLLPRGAVLQAELLVPTRAIGFVQVGQPVMLRYQAFPYERFGQFGGKVASIGRTVWNPGESIGPLATREPVYRVVVSLDAQKVNAHGQNFDLRAGMLLNADLLLERRTLLEWMFEPVLRLRQRLQ